MVSCSCSQQFQLISSKKNGGKKTEINCPRHGSLRHLIPVPKALLFTIPLAQPLYNLSPAGAWWSGSLLHLLQIRHKFTCREFHCIRIKAWNQLPDRINRSDSWFQLSPSFTPHSTPRIYRPQAPNGRPYKNLTALLKRPSVYWYFEFTNKGDCI